MFSLKHCCWRTLEVGGSACWRLIGLLVVWLADRSSRVYPTSQEPQTLHHHPQALDSPAYRLRTFDILWSRYPFPTIPDLGKHRSSFAPACLRVATFATWSEARALGRPHTCMPIYIIPISRYLALDRFSILTLSKSTRATHYSRHQSLLRLRTGTSKAPAVAPAAPLLVSGARIPGNPPILRLLFAFRVRLSWRKARDLCRNFTARVASLAEPVGACPMSHVPLGGALPVRMPQSPTAPVPAPRQKPRENPRRLQTVLKRDQLEIPLPL